MSEIDKWKKFANDIKLKRTNTVTKQNRTKAGEGNTSAGSSILENKEITVQPLATEATGKAKKYERTGPQEFVPFLFKDITIENIILACNKHFKNRLKGMSCDVLASERGPSCTKITQLPNLKLIHVRFVMKNDEDSGRSGYSSAVSSGISGSLLPRCSGPYVVESRSQSSTSMLAHPTIARSTSAIGLKRKLDDSFRCESPIPKSLGVTSMMKLGKAITNTETLQEVVEVSAFNIDSMIWSPPVSAHFRIEKEIFAQGGFRAAFKATSKSPHFEGKTYVVKRLLPETVDLIGEVKETPEEQARKSVQMQSLANNFAEQVAAKVSKSEQCNVYGKTFRYVDAFLGKVQSTNEIITIEQYVSGTFQKYVNNDGSLSNNQDNDRQKKAESLTHFSFAKSNRKLLLVDIQGSGYDLTDPEIASVTGAFDDEHHLLFCVGNLSLEAYSNFFKAHKCSVFCTILGLSCENIEDGLSS